MTVMGDAFERAQFNEHARAGNPRKIRAQNTDPVESLLVVSEDNGDVNLYKDRRATPEPIVVPTATPAPIQAEAKINLPGGGTMSTPLNEKERDILFNLAMAHMKAGIKTEKVLLWKSVATVAVSIIGGVLFVGAVAYGTKSAISNDN